jgi:hypothetical protein
MDTPETTPPPRPPRGHSPELTADAEAAAESMLEDAIRRVVDHWMTAPPAGPPSTTARTWLDNRRPGRYGRPR